jgi:PXA domain.
MKEVDWIPYLTTRLVDDAASHLRLFRQACAKMKHQRSRHKRQASSDIRFSVAGATEPGKACVLWNLSAVVDNYVVEGFLSWSVVVVLLLSVSMLEPFF